MSERAGLWLRVSTKDQDEANQLPDLLAWCEAHGYEVVEPYYAVHGKSAYHGKHDAYLDKAIADMKAGRIRVLVVWQSSRIERRGAYNAFDLARRVREAGGRIEYVKDSYLNDTNDMSDVMLALSATKDHQESKARSERTVMVQSRIRAGGKLVGRYPFGYTSTGEKYSKELVPTEVGREYVPGIFDMVTDGLSLAKVSEWLKAEGVPTNQGHDWSPNRIAALVRNPVYMGRRCEYDVPTKTYGRTLHRCEALVDAASWKRANDNLNARPGRGKRPATVHPEALLKSVLACPRCDGPMYRIMTRDGAFYRCAGKGAVRKTTCKNMVECSALDSLVSGFMSTLTDEITRTAFTPGHNHDAEIQAVKDEMRDLAMRDLPDDAYDAELSRLRAERDRLAAAEATPDTFDEVSTGETYAGRWESLEAAERGAWLRSARLRVWATRADRKPAHVRYGDRLIEPGVTLQSREGKPGQVTATEGNGVWAVIAWNIERL